MNLKYLGLTLIFLGFLLAFLLRIIAPAFVFVSVVYLLCFWIGFLLVLRPGNFDVSIRPYAKWAGYAIWINIILMVCSLIYFSFIFSLGSGNKFGFFMYKYSGFVLNPVRSFFDFIATKQIVERVDGSVVGTYSVTRAILTDFFNLVFYSMVGVLAKLIIDGKITSAFTGRPKLISI